MREAARQPADRGLRDPGEVRGRPVPGLVRRASTRCSRPRRVGDGRAAVARRRRPARRRRRDHPRRLLLRRLPAGRRDRALRAGDGARSSASRATAGSVLGICNGFQVLCEAGLLPGALLPNTSLRFVCRQVELEVVNALDRVDRRVRGRRALSIPAKHTTGRYWAPDPVLDELEANGQVVLRYAPGENFNGSSRDIAGVSQRGGQRRRADAAPGARGRRADRLRRRAEAVRASAARRSPAPDASTASSASPTTSTT